MAVAFVKAHAVVSEKTLDTSASVTVDTGGIAAGNLIVLAMVTDNAATVGKPLISSITRQSGETATWASLGVAQHPSSTSIGAFVAGHLWAIKTTVAWAAGTYTVTLDTAVTQKAAAFIEFSGAEATLRSTVATQYQTTTTAAVATTTGTTPVIGDLGVGFSFQSNSATAQQGDTDTTGGSWTPDYLTPIGIGSTGGSGATNNFGSFQYKILTAASHQSFSTNGGVATAGNGAVSAILRATPEVAITQAAYRLYADGTETGSTALAAQDTAATADLSSGDVNLGIRVRLQETAGSPSLAATDDYQLQWEKNANGVWHAGNSGTVLVDSNERPVTTNSGLYATVNRIGQSFLGNGGSLVRASFTFSVTGVPNGTVTAALYAHSGTYGSGGIATGSPLATSTTSVASTSVTGTQWYDFDFDGTYTLVEATPYVIVATTTNTLTSADSPRIAQSGLGHAGNYIFYNSVTPAWGASAADIRFRVYYTAPVTGDAVLPFASASLTDAAATTNRLGSGTGSFVAGKVSEDGLVDNLSWSASNYTELLYSVTLKQAYLANGDTLRFRVLRNGATTGFTYTQTPTINVTVGAGVPSGTGTGSYDFTKTTATGYKLPLGSTTTGTYTFNSTAATGAKVQRGTAVGAYAYAGTSTGLTPTIGPKTGTATGTHTWAGTAVGSNVAALVYDDFTGVDSTTLLWDGPSGPGRTTPIGAKTWTGQVQDWGLISNQAYMPGTGGHLVADAAQANVVVECDYTTGATRNNTGLLLRWADANNYVAVFANSGGNWYIQKRIAGTPTNLTNGGVANASTTYALRVVCSGTSVRLYVNTVLTLSGTVADAALLTPTKFGLVAAGSGTDHRWDNFKITLAAPEGTAAGSSAFDRTAATGYKVQRGTATTGAYLWARTAATGVVVKRATATTGTYAWNRTAATGARAAQGSTVGGTYTWTGNAQGLAPTIGVKQGTAIGAYLWARTLGTGTKTTTGTAAGTYLWARTTATGSSPQRGSTAGTYAWNRTAATGYRLSRSTAGGNYTWARTTATGITAPKGAATGAYAYAGTAAGTRTQRGTTTGSYAWNRTTATGTKTPRGTTSGTYLWARTTAVGSKPAGATAVGTYSWNRTTATGYKLPKAQSITGTWNWSGIASGIRPVLGLKQGTAQGFYSWNRTAAVGSAPVVPVKAGTAAGTYLWARTTATGARPSRATSVGGFDWSRTTGTGSRTPKASSSGTYLYVGTGTGIRPSVLAKTGTAVGAYHYTGTATGVTPQAAGYVEDFDGHPAQVWAGGTRYPIQTFET